MKNKALIIIVLTSFMIPLGAVNLAVANDKNTSLFGDKIEAIQVEASHDKTTSIVITSHREDEFWRPIKRKFRFRRGAPRCPGF